MPKPRRRRGRRASSRRLPRLHAAHADGAVEQLDVAEAIGPEPAGPPPGRGASTGSAASTSRTCRASATASPGEARSGRPSRALPEHGHPIQVVRGDGQRAQRPEHGEWQPRGDHADHVREAMARAVARVEVDRERPALAHRGGHAGEGGARDPACGAAPRRNTPCRTCRPGMAWRRCRPARGGHWAGCRCSRTPHRWPG